MDEDEEMRIPPLPPLAPSLSSAFTEPNATLPLPVSSSTTISKPSTSSAPASAHLFQSSVPASVPTLSSSTLTLSSLAHAASTSASGSASASASASISAASSRNVSPTLAHRYPFSASAENLTSVLNNGDSKRKSQVSSLSAALSTIAQEELLQLERKEAERRREYELAHAELERRAAGRWAAGGTGAGEEAVSSRLTRSANASPDSTPLFGHSRPHLHPISNSDPHSQRRETHRHEYDEQARFEYGSRPHSEYYDRQHHSVYCDGDSMVDARTYGGQHRGSEFTGGLVPRLPSCHHEECHKSYRTLLKMTRHQNQNSGLHSSTSVPDVVGHVHSAATGGGSGHSHSKTVHRHHPYEPAASSSSSVLQHHHHHSHPPHPAPLPLSSSGGPLRKPSPTDTTPSPISEEGTRLLPPLPPLSASSASYGPLSSNSNADEYAYYTPSTSPFLHAPYPHSHGGTPPGTPAPLTMMSRRKKGNNNTSGASGSKFAIDSLLSSPKERPAPLHLPPLHSSVHSHSHSHSHVSNGAPTPALSTGSASQSSPESGMYHPAAIRAGHGAEEEDVMMKEEEDEDEEDVRDRRMLPPILFPPPPTRSRPSSEHDAMSPVRLSPMGSYDGSGGFHSAMMVKQQQSSTLPPLIPGLPTSASPPLSSATLSGSSGGRMSGASSPTTPVSGNAQAHSHLAHSVRIAFGMTPIHPPNYFSSRGRSTLGFGSSSVRGTAATAVGNHPNGSGSGSGSSSSGRSETASVRSASPPIVLPPLRISSVEEEEERNGVRTPAEEGSSVTTTTKTSSSNKTVTELPHLDELAGRLGQLVKTKQSGLSIQRPREPERDDNMELE
ncbi:hypothetical protein FRC20_002584 [Serendipita sp. 405]|nr:hypothetical protein FRC20_002584 [Serendipita sp. 405]